MKNNLGVPRSIKSWALANIILDNDLYLEFSIFCSNHRKIKSKVRAAVLFLKHKGLLYRYVDNCVSVNMDTLESYVLKYCPECLNSIQKVDANLIKECGL